jgi:hypothetical protein
MQLQFHSMFTTHCERAGATLVHSEIVSMPVGGVSSGHFIIGFINNRRRHFCNARFAG